MTAEIGANSINKQIRNRNKIKSLAFQTIRKVNFRNKTLESSEGRQVVADESNTDTCAVLRVLNNLNALNSLNADQFLLFFRR